MMIEVMDLLVEISSVAVAIGVDLGLGRGLETGMMSGGTGIGTGMIADVGTALDLIQDPALVLLSIGEIGIEAHIVHLVVQTRVTTKERQTELLKRI